MAQDGSLEMLDQLRIWIEQRFQSLHTTTSNNEATNKASTRYRKLTSIIHQLESLGLPIPEDVVSEISSLEEYLLTPSEELSELGFLSKELSSLAKDINYRLRNMRIQKIPTGNKAPRKRLRVELSDGTIIEELKAIDTFVDAIRHIGLQCVSELPIKKDGASLVSTQEPELPSWKFRKTEGYFINTHSSTGAKAKYIKRIVETLRLNVSVRIVD